MFHVKRAEAKGEISMGIEAPIVDASKAGAESDAPTWVSGNEPGATLPTPPPDPNAPVPGQAPASGATGDIDAAVQKRIDVEVSRRKVLEDRLAKLEGGGGGDGRAPVDAPFKFEAYEGFKSKFLASAASTPEGAQAVALFDGLHQAITADFARAIEGYIADQLAPYQQFRTNVESDGFYKTNSAAAGKREEVEALVQKYPGMDRQDAWKIVNYGAPTGPARPQKSPPPGSSIRGQGAPVGDGNPYKGKSFAEVAAMKIEERRRGQ
jgi:hypothetical protein